jgi:hypothetical protein
LMEAKRKSDLQNHRDAGVSNRGHLVRFASRH